MTRIFLTSKQKVLKKYRSPQVGFEPTTNRLTADRSTTELLRNNIESSISYIFKDFCSLNRSIMQELLKNKKTQRFFWNFGNFAYTLPSILQKKGNDSNPLRLPGERLRDKGRRSTITMIFSTVSFKMRIDQLISTVLQFCRLLSLY